MCAWFDGGLILIKDPLSKLEPGDLPYCSPGHAFKGYMQIPIEMISPGSKKIYFYPMLIIEAITHLNDHLPMKADPPNSFASSNYYKEMDDYLFGPISVDCNDALIPTEDLLNLSSKKVNSEKQLTTSERNTFLTIIGLMAKDGYKDDLKKPYPLAKEIQEAADLLGIKISDDTIASKLKEAKAILDEKSQ